MKLIRIHNVFKKYYKYLHIYYFRFYNYCNIKFMSVQLFFSKLSPYVHIANNAANTRHSINIFFTFIIISLLYIFLI